MVRLLEGVQSGQGLSSCLLSWNHKFKCMVSQDTTALNLLMPSIRCYLCGTCKAGQLSGKKKVFSLL